VALWKVSIEGGEAFKLTDVADYPLAPTISPDGKFIAYYWRKRDPEQSPEIVVFRFDAPQVSKSFKLPVQYFSGIGKNALQWTPDGKAVNYILIRKDVSNIWRRPIDGSQPVQVTDLKDQRIFNFSFSPNGKNLTLSRGTFNRDVILVNKQP
jgi:Tol biopolymer transport system component